MFAWNEFPSCEFERPLYVERMIGPYTIDVTYYDKDYNVVTEALEPGRYGAVARIKTEAGRTFTRFSTLFRKPERLRWWRHKLEGSIKLPEELGIDPEVAIEQVKHVIEQMKRAFSNQTRRSDGPAKLLAGLYEMAPGQGEASVFEDPSARDRQWWLGLKRKLNGNDNRYGAFVCPRPIEGPPAPVLREGTLDEAGMKASAAERIDAHLTEWAGDTDEAFDVCVARHGVIVLHKAYGTRDGEPMTTHTKSYMASLTKLFSGTIMMMLVDQGLVDLDDTVDKFLPSLSGIEVETPATIQRLYTHTAGMWGHWGDHTNDFEHKVAECYPYLKIGKNRGYNGMSQALGSKIVEQLSGEALPIFYKKHLLDPLGCQDTDVTNSSYDAHSTARDMATIGQMLLNGGAYGDKRFFSEETFEKMLPRRLTKAIGPETEVVWGMGCYWAYDGATSDRTVTHGAASWATMRIDVKNDLVISMTRNSAGRNFHKYRLPFIQAVVEGMKGNGK